MRKRDGVIKYIELRQNLKSYSEHYLNYKNHDRKKSSKKTGWCGNGDFFYFFFSIFYNTLIFLS